MYYLDKLFFCIFGVKNSFLFCKWDEEINTRRKHLCFRSRSNLEIQLKGIRVGNANSQRDTANGNISLYFLRFEFTALLAH